MPKYMGRSQTLASQQNLHLPTEILVQIASLILEEGIEDDGLGFQSTLHSFCLVSRQWYSAGIEFLYSQPQLARGNSFSLFTRTVCPPIRSRERKVDLGSLVQHLDLSGLVHHSSNSLTARLLGRVKKNLKSFTAPRVSFSFNSLAPISKCKAMTHLSLSLIADAIPLYDLRRAIVSLGNLESLKLPPSLIITGHGWSKDWPPHLKWLEVGGCFDLETMPNFKWPKALEGLTLIDCENLTSVLTVIFMNAQLCATLKELTISSYHQDSLLNEPIVALSRCVSLRCLRLPIDGLFGTNINPLFDLHSIPRTVRELMLTSAVDESFSGIDVDHICKALVGKLSQVCGIGLSPDHYRCLPRASRVSIDKLLWANIDDCPQDEIDDLFDLGLYELDS